jgi:hypothetical protein
MNGRADGGERRQTPRAHIHERPSTPPRRGTQTGNRSRPSSRRSSSDNSPKGRSGLAAEGSLQSGYSCRANRRSLVGRNAAARPASSGRALPKTLSIAAMRAESSSVGLRPNSLQPSSLQRAGAPGRASEPSARPSKADRRRSSSHELRRTISRKTAAGRGSPSTPAAVSASQRRHFVSSSTARRARSGAASSRPSSSIVRIAASSCSSSADSASQAGGRFRNSAAGAATSGSSRRPRTAFILSAGLSNSPAEKASRLASASAVLSNVADVANPVTRSGPTPKRASVRRSSRAMSVASVPP